MKITNKQLAIGGGIAILLFFMFRKKPVLVAAEVETEDGAVGGGGGVIPTTLTRESIITPVVVGAAQTIPPVMTVAPAPSPIAVSPSNPIVSNVTPGRATPTPLPIVQSKPATSPLINANARFDGLDDYSFDGAIGF